MRLVLFDIDGTLVSGASTERRFYRYLWRRGEQRPRQFFGAIAGLGRALLRHGRQVFKKNKGYLVGLPVDRVTRLAGEWAQSQLQACLYQPAVSRLRQHQAAKDHIVLLSGTPDSLARAIADQLGVAQAVGSIVPVHDGRYSSSEPISHPFADRKRTIAEGLARTLRIDPQDVVAYGDSQYDQPLLDWAGEAIAVNPDARLNAVARARGWTILDQATEPPDDRAMLKSWR